MVSWAVLLLRVAELFGASRGLYGSPRITEALAALGLPVGRRRVISAMQALGLQAMRGTKSGDRGNRKNAFRIHKSREISRCINPDLLRRSFSLGELNRRWVSDISDLGLAIRARYLCIVVDLASRRVVAWQFGSSPNGHLVIGTLRTALGQRRPESDLIVHSDRGGEYANHSVGRFLRRHHAMQSMSRRGNCWDNAVAESFFATLKRECIYLLPSHERVRPAAIKGQVADYIRWYNEQRLHSTLGYRSPVDYEDSLTDSSRE